MKKRLLSTVLALACVSSFAENFTLSREPSSLSDWKDASFYTGDAAPTGASTDEIVVPAGMTVTVADSMSDVVSFLCGIGNLRVKRAAKETDTRARLVIDVAENHTLEWAGTLSSYNEDGVAGNYSYVEKTGKGTLKLLKKSQGAYQSHWVISAGEVWLPEQETTSSSHYKYYGPVVIAHGARVRTDNCTGNSYWQVSGLYNAGHVTNGSEAQTPIYVTSGVAFSEEPPGDGTFEGNISISVRSTDFALMGTTNTFSSVVVIDGRSQYGNKSSRLTVARLGKKADSSSSLGVADPGVHMAGELGGCLVYAGHGESSDKDLRLIAAGSSTTAPNEINGGVYGGLRLTGRFTKYDTSTTWNPLIVFAGDHENPCEFAGVNEDFQFVYTPSSPYYNQTYVRYIKKTGTGEWHFPFNKNYKSGGTIAVENGTLSFDCIDAKGRVCSIGTATRCYAESALQPENSVDYAYLLGGDTVTKTGMFECRTNVVQQCTDRPFGLKGRGGFRANCGEVRYANVFGVGAGAATLVLDGTNEFENVVCDVSDGTAGGTVGIEKNGSGTWVLGGDQTFSGPLAVNGGTLIVRRPQQVYRRYRLLVKEIVDNSQAWQERGIEHKNFSGVSFAEVGLWNASNRRVNMNLSYNANYLALAPGECAWGWTLTGPSATTTALLFDGNRYTASDSSVGKIWGALSSTMFYSHSVLNSGARQSDSLTWIPLDMYLADGEGPVDHFDVLAGDSSGPDQRTPSVFQLQASVDGIHWDEVTDDCTYTHTNTRYCWLYNGNGGSGANGSKDDGYPGQNSPDDTFFNRSLGWKVTKTAPTKEFSMLENVGAVTVANGAVLKYEGLAAGAPELSRVKLAAGATGAIDGFKFAESGTFEIDEMPQGSVSVAVALPNSTGLDNVAGWAVKVGGVSKLSYHVLASPTGFTVQKSGLSIIFR